MDRKLSKAGQATLEKAMRDFIAGVEEHRRGAEDGTLDTLHDVEHVSLEKMDDHLKPAVVPEKK